MKTKSFDNTRSESKARGRLGTHPESRNGSFSIFRPAPFARFQVALCIAAAVFSLLTIPSARAWDTLDPFDDSSALGSGSSRPSDQDDPVLRRQGKTGASGNESGSGLEWTDPLKVMMESGGTFSATVPAGASGTQVLPVPEDIGRTGHGNLGSGPQIAALRLEVSGSPMPGTTIEIRGFAMADLYPLGQVEFLFSLPPGFVTVDPLNGTLKNLPVWEWREVLIRARVPEVPEAGEIYFIVDAPIDPGRLKEWVKTRRDEGEKIDSGIEDRLENLDENIRVAVYLNPWWTRWECYSDSPPYHAFVIDGDAGPGPALVLDDPGALEAASTGMLQEEESDLRKRLGTLSGEDRQLEKACARELAAVRYRLAFAGAMSGLAESGNQGIRRTGSWSAGEGWPSVASKALRSVEKVMDKLPPPVTVPDRALRQMMAITSAALILSGKGGDKKKAARAVEILESSVAELEKPMYRNRPEGWLKRYALYNLGVALGMLGRGPEAAVRFKEASVAGPGFLAPLEAAGKLSHGPGGRKK